MLLPNPYGDLKMDSADRSTQKDTSSSAVTSSLGDLIARLEKATGPDRELDVGIAAAIFGSYQFFGDERRFWINGSWESAPNSTGSMDAAISLVPRPMCWNGGEVNEDDQPWACITDSEGADYAATAATPILALCIAALKARSLPAI